MMAFAFGFFLHDFLHREAELEAGAHPRHVGHLAAENFLRQLLAICRGRDRDDRVRVHVIDDTWPGMKLCSGVSIDDARGFRLNVVWVYMPTMSSSAGDLRPLSVRAA